MLGCLVEKQLTTPQQYPLTLNALTLACSQSTNREPVMTLDDGAVLDALGDLKEAKLVRFVLPSHGKSVIRYRHVLDEAYGLDAGRAALVAVLLLRGPQTPGELRARTARMAEFDSTAAVQAELDILAGQPEPLVRLLPRQPGQKEDRWQQLLAAESGGSTTQLRADGQPPEGTSVPPADAGTARAGPTITALEDQVTALQEMTDALRNELAGLRVDVDELRQDLGDLRRSLGE